MPNALVEQLRRALPAKTQGRSDAELTESLARSFEARGDLDRYREEYPDFDEELLNVRNAGGNIAAETKAGLAAGLLDRLPGAVQSAGALAADMVAREELAANLGLAVPAQRVGDSLRGAAEANRREAAARIAEAGGRTIARVEDIRPTSPRDYILWALPTFAENIPSMAASLGVGAATGLATKNPVAALGAATATSVGQNVGETYGELQDPGIDRDKAIRAALVGGTLAGVVDVLPEIAPLAKLIPGAKQGVLGKIVEGVLGRGGWAGAGRGAFTQSLGEGATEAVQEAINIAAEEYASGKELEPDTVRSRLLNAAAAGAVIGAPVGAAVGALPNKAETIAGEKIDDEWTTFSPQSQTVGVPRAEMPQVPSEKREELTEFLSERGIESKEEAVLPGALKPTQAEFSPAKVEQARAHEGDDRKLIVSADNHIVDGHHQWVRDLTDAPDKPVEVVKLQAPIAELIPAVKEFPGAKAAEGATTNSAPISSLLVADFAPARIAKTTSNDLAGDDGRGGRFAIAIEKNGRVEVRNVYERKGGERMVENAAELVPHVKVRGTGRNLQTLLKDGWTVKAEPFQLAGQQPNLKLSLAPAEFDAKFAESKAQADEILTAINEGRGDRVVEAGLKQADPKAWRAVEFLRDWISAETGVAPSHALIGLGTRVDSSAARDSLRTSATMKKLAAGDLLRKKDGKVFGIFTDQQWDDFKSKVEKGQGDIALVDDLFFSRDKAIRWALNVGELGLNEQIGEQAFATKANGEETLTTVDEAPETATEAAAPDDAVVSGKQVAALEAEGISAKALGALLAQADLTEDFVAEQMATAPEFDAFRKRIKKQGAKPAQIRATIQSILSLHEARSQQDGSVQNGRGSGQLHSRGRTGDEGRAPVSLRSQPVEPLADSSFRASESAVARAWGAAVAALSDAGIQVRALQAAIDDVDAFYQATGGRTDARRFIELVLKDLAAPSGTDLEVAVHEATHVLFAAQPENIRAALHRAVAKLPDPDPATNLSLQHPDPEIRAQEKLAVLLQGDGIDAGAAKDFASRLVRFLKDLYFRTARALSLALGLNARADAFALRHFRNRLDALLQGDLAPQSLSNALGGRPLTWSERAVMLPGFGRSVGRVLNGLMLWTPKVPDTAEALAFNLDLAFSRPPENESEANVRKGIDAVNRVLADHALKIKGAMYRPEVGSITFEWGNPGDPKKAFRGGFGIGHILARRSVVGKIPPIEVLAMVIETIAYGDASAPYGGEGDTRVRIDDGNNSVILSLARDGKRETWMITSFDNTRGQTPGSMVKNNASVTGAVAKTVPSAKAAQVVDAFSLSDLVAVTDGLKLGGRMRVVKAGDMLYSRPLQAAIGAVDNPANSINRDIATLNHSIGVEAAAVNALTTSQALSSVISAAMNGTLDLAAWFRSQFHFEDPTALKQMALGRLDPQTQQPVQGVNPAQSFADFASVANSAPARIHAHLAARKRLKTLSARLTQDREDLTRAKNRHGLAQKAFLDAHRNYLNAEGLTSLVLKGVRQLVARERRIGLQTSKQVGTVMQQLRELDSRSAETIDREYSGVFKKLFRGTELRGRNLFDLLDQMVNEANIDFRDSKVTEIRQKLAERVAAGMASPEMGMLINATPSSRALLATVVAYGKTHPEVLAQIERRRLKNIAERLELQDALEKVIAERDITNTAIRDLPKTAKLEERARVLYVQAKRRDRALADGVAAIEQRIAAAEAALPIYRTAVEQLERELGGVRPDYTFGDGMVYRVPVKTATGVELQPRTLRLNSTGQLTDRSQLDHDLAAMTEWLGLKESLGELDADYRDVWAARHALLEGGYFETDLRKTDTWVRGNLFMPVGERAAATGLPTGRIANQMFNTFAATENELKAQGQRFGDRNNRLRDAAIAVLNRGRKTTDMTADRYFAEFAEPAMSIVEKARDLMEMGLTPEQVRTRAFQRVLNHLLSNPSTAPYVRGKEQAVMSALRGHLESLEQTSKFYHDTNQRHGLGVRDERLITDRGDGEEVAGIRDSLPVGPMTFSRKFSATAGRVYRIMVSRRWGRLADLDAAEIYRTQGAAGLRAELAPFFSDPAILQDFVAAMATTDTYSPFDAPVLADGVTRGEADPARVAQAWRAAGGDVVTFIENLYAAHHGTTDIAQYAGEVLGRMDEYYRQLGEMLDPGESGMTPDGLSRLTSNLMIDARTLDRWPTAWTEYLFFDPHTNHALARRVSAQVAFGRDTSRLAQVWATLEKEMDAVKAEFDAVADRERKIGFTGRKLRTRIEADYVRRLGAKGRAEFARAERIVELRPAVAEARDQIRAFFSSKHNQLDAVRFASQLGQTVAFGMLNSPGTALVNLADLFAPVAQGGVSGATLKHVLSNWKYLGEGVAGSLAQAVGLDLLKSSRLQNLYVSMGFNDPAVALQYIAKTEDGLRSDIVADQAARGFDESAATKAMRLFQRTVAFGITPKGEDSRFTALRPLAPFQQFVLETMRASTLSTWQRVEDMILGGLEYFAKHPNDARDPNFKLTGDALGLKGAELAAFEALRTRLAEGYGLELTTLTREAMTRQAGPRAMNELLSPTSRALLQGMVANELILEGNLATMTPKAWTSTTARLVLPLLGWPIRRAMAVAKMGFDSKDRFRMEAVGRGMAALGVMAAAGLAMSLLADEYHERIVGRKRNLRSVKSLPAALSNGQAGEAFMTVLENVNRAGTFGMWGEVLNAATNIAHGGGDNRTLSLDTRIVMANSMFSMFRAVSAWAAQGEVDYSGVVRPTIMALGGNAALQYVQIGNNALGLDNLESRFIEKVDTQNRLRVAGRELGLEVRTGGYGAMSAPTPLTPVVNRMVLAAYAGNRADFLAEWRDAVRTAKEMGKADPVVYVRDSFAGRHPLKNVFRSLSEDDYVKLLRHLDPRGRQEVRDAVNRFNAYAESLDARAFVGSSRRRGSGL